MSTLVEGKDPREGALAEEIRVVEAAILAEEIRKLSSATGSKLGLDGKATDPYLDEQYSTDEEHVLQIRARHNLSSAQTVNEQSAEDLRTGTYMYEDRVIHPSFPFVPSVVLTSPTEHLEVPERPWTDIHGDREMFEDSFTPSLPVPEPSARPSQAAGELRRSPRRHTRRGPVEVLKRLTPALQAGSCSKTSVDGIENEKLPDAVYNLDEDKDPKMLPEAAEEETAEATLIISKGKGPEIFHAVDKEIAPEIILRVDKGKAPEKIPVPDKGKAPEVVRRAEKRKAPNVVRRAVKRKTGGKFPKIDKGKAPEVIGEFNEGASTQAVRMHHKEKSPEVLPHFEDGCIDPVLLSKNPNFDSIYLSRAREENSWLSQRAGNMKTGELKLRSNFELPPGTNWETPRFNGEQPLPPSENDMIEAEIRADEGIDWAYDPQAFSYFDLAFFSEDASDMVGTELEISEFFKGSMDINDPVASGSNQVTTNMSLNAPPNEGITISSLTGLHVYDWGFPEYNAEETELPDANDFGYFLEETNSEGVVVRKFYPYTEQDDWTFQ
ncbi:hypothetical protein P167DRAFT_547649 [Morchella conica CCBAS932]|uniref:Uncharacterized protein n=1 Tax=Morchella conica CCBAS932 TaxID=1392247 RepID=A0A3N4KHC7_9PEZI|nr:hypothetical protein P167DRAFT_547649 [Morchella conica CCBAS932]